MRNCRRNSTLPVFAWFICCHIYTDRVYSRAVGSACPVVHGKGTGGYKMRKCGTYRKYKEEDNDKV